MLRPGGGGGRPQKEGLDGRGWYQAWVAATGMFGSATDHALVTFVESSYMYHRMAGSISIKFDCATESIWREPTPTNPSLNTDHVQEPCLLRQPTSP